MRTLLWINTIKTNGKCENEISTVVYLYELKTEDLAKKATQNVWSKILTDLKEQKGDEILLIPIAILENYSVEKYPVVIINNKEVISELSGVENLVEFLE